MNRPASISKLNVAFAGSALLISGASFAQSGRPSEPNTKAQPSTGAPASGKVPSSNPRGSLPQMSADRCLAEAIGTAADPKTGAPAQVTVNPETGKPLCPPVDPAPIAKPPR